ncbi:MAG: hypothetical protein IKO68_05980 [Oscillospiraceae bacterium]|nr:hypothetical protein [Oscillospiraceae bacterium]
MMAKLRAGKKLEYGVFFLYIALYCLITVYHEPWFDEAQSWQIAKCASLRELFLEIPHYEGHPPLWWLILAIPAKLGVPFEIGLKSVGFLIAVPSVYLILFRLPYPRLMRLLLPLSYFVFYQYGIIVRPYGLMMLAFLLLALAFPGRDRHPWRFAGLLALLCLTSAYGIVMAGGIALCRVWELLREKGLKGFILGAFRDRRSLALGVLLIAAILLVMEIMPRSDTLVTSKNAVNSFPLCLLCALLTFVGECTITTSSWFSIDRTLLQHVYLPTGELVLMCVIGCLLWVLIIGASSKRHLKYLLVPYILLSLFSAMVYFSVHHVGVVLLLLLFWLGALFQDENRFEIGRAVIRRIAKNDRDTRLLKKTALAACAVCLLVPVFWSVSSSISEIQKEYSYGRHAAAFLKEHDLENSRIFSIWGTNASLAGLEEDDGLPHNSDYVGIPVLITAYYDRNICLNLNCGKDDEAYMHYRIASEEEDAESIASWRENGVPDILLGKADLELVFDGIDLDQYTLVEALPVNYIWKTSVSSGILPLCARNDIMDQYQLEPLEDEGINLWFNGFRVTDEMREAYENGVPMEEILKPYLDALFGVGG